MTFNHLNKRTHLYLALFLLPWFLMYSISSLMFSHRQLFKNKIEPEWTKQIDRSYNLPIQEEDDLRKIALQILKDVDMEGSFWVNLQKDLSRLNINQFDSWSATRLIYHIDEQRLTAEHKKFTLRDSLTRMHARGGFQQESTLMDVWAIIVDIVCISFLIWIATGIYMWWNIKPSRSWGFIALGGGFLCYMIFLLAL